MKRQSPAETTTDFPPPQPLNHSNKKTRDLPNLSDCYCCSRRINCTNPKNKLGILTSEWRIVLLCKKCHSLVESSQFCSYCLTRVSSAFYECKKCRRRIHKDCVSKFSFGSSGNCSDEFSVCFDCWIPNLLENEYSRSRAVRIGTSKKQAEKNGVESTSLASSDLCNLQKKEKVLENVVNEANADAERKIVIAIEAKEKVLTKVMAAKKAMDIASGSLGIVEIDQGGLVVDEDAQLAIRLHREMNSSPRISRNLCSMNTHCVDVPKVNGLELQGANETSCSDRATYIDPGDNGLESGLGHERTGSREARQESGNKFGRKQDGKYNDDSKSCVITYIRKGKASKGVKCKKKASSFLKVYSRKPSKTVKVEGGQCPSHAVKLDAYHYRFQFLKLEGGQCSKTYSRRRLNCKSKLVNSSLNLQNGNLASDMSLNCREEPRALANAS
ncbi:uncharacterized protein LOC141642870 [Silene latifolia]|uniref:uncharacterized protein LOC141642870 n=1 Tax=Silene latifolia TaxID=37657 RepID=UPI003D77110E